MTAMRRHIAICIALALAGCEKVRKKLEPHGKGGASGSSGSAEGGPPAPQTVGSGSDTRLSLPLTAAYEQPPLRLLLVVDRCVTGSEYYTRNSLKRFQYALKVLGARTAFATTDSKIGILDLASKDGALLAVIPSDSPSAVDDLVAKAAPDCPTGDANTPQIIEQSETLPLTALKKALAKADEPGAENALMVQNGVRLSIVFVESGPEGREETLPEDITALLDKKVGAGNWRVSAVTGSPDDDKAGSCSEYDQGDFSLALADGAGGTGSDAPGRLVTRLQEQTKGLFLSHCELSWARFFQKVLAETTDSASFTVDLGQKALWASIAVKVGDYTVGGWRYKVGESKLDLPRTIPPGTALNVLFAPDDGTKANVADEPVDPTERVLPPEEREFNAQISNTLGYYCGSCHGPGGQQKRFVDRYATVKTLKSSLVDRLQKPDGDAMKMPPAGSTALPADDKDRLVAYFQKL